MASTAVMPMERGLHRIRQPRVAKRSEIEELVLFTEYFIHQVDCHWDDMGADLQQALYRFAMHVVKPTNSVRSAIFSVTLPISRAYWKLQGKDKVEYYDAMITKLARNTHCLTSLILDAVERTNAQHQEAMASSVHNALNEPYNSSGSTEDFDEFFSRVSSQAFS